MTVLNAVTRPFLARISISRTCHLKIELFSHSPAILVRIGLSVRNSVLITSTEYEIRTCSMMLNTSACAFSTARGAEGGLLRRGNYLFRSRFQQSWYCLTACEMVLQILSMSSKNICSFPRRLQQYCQNLCFQSR